MVRPGRASGPRVVRAGLAPDEQDPQLRQLRLDRRQQGRTANEARDLSIPQEIGELVREQRDARRTEDEGAPAIREPRSPPRRNRRRSSCPGRRDRRARKAIPLRRDPDEIADAGCSMTTPLGLPVVPEV